MEEPIPCPETAGKKTSMFFFRLSAFSRKQSFEVGILSSSKMSHIPEQGMGSSILDLYRVVSSTLLMFAGAFGAGKLICVGHHFAA